MNRRWPYLLVVVLAISCLGLGGVAWYVLNKDRKLRRWERREADQLLAQQLAQPVQQTIQQQLRVIQSLPSSQPLRVSAQQLQQSLSKAPWIWHAVALDRDGEIRWPSLPWQGKDDASVLRLAQQATCEDFRRNIALMEVGEATRLGASLLLQRRLPSCDLSSWVKVALLRDAHVRWRSSRTWRFSSTNDSGYWLLRSRSSLMILRSHPSGWIGFAIRLHHNLRRGVPQRWRQGLRSVWLARQPRLSVPPARVSYTALPDILSGYALYVEMEERDQSVSWLLLGLVGLCVLLAAWASFLIVRLLQRQRQLMQQRDEWFASITHELKTPVAAQLALLDTLNRDELSLSQRRQYQTTLRKEVLRLQRLVENVLALQRDSFPPRNQTHVDCTSMCHSLLEEFEIQAMERGIELVCDERTPYHVFCDAGELELSLRHLIDNAIKYSHPNGWVRVELSVSSRVVSIVVRDSGPGIAPEKLGMLWEPFERGENRDVAGSGLGLYLAQRILLRHQGALALRKHPEQGVFEVTLPRSYPNEGN